MLENGDLVPILYEYDTIGPILANLIRNDDEKEQICGKLFQNYLSIIIEYIDSGKYLSAINKYVEMVNSLKEFYKPLIEEVPYQKDMEVTGHGYLKRK